MLLSKNGVALIVLFLSFIGLEATEDGIAELVSAVGTVVSFFLMLWNQLDRSDVDKFIFKKKD